MKLFPAGRAILFLLRATYALEVTPGSSCAKACLASKDADIYDSTASSTKTSEITCQDLNFSTKDNGIKFQNCLECLQTSDKVNETESDQKWFIYNLRYAVSTCLFSEPAATSKSTQKNACATNSTCLPFQAALVAGLPKNEASEVYDYCTADSSSFAEGDLKPCLTCLQESDDQVFMANFFTALEAGCKENVKSGNVIGLSGTLFSKNAVNITGPSDGDDSKDGNSSGLSKPVIAVICVAVGLLALAAVALFVFYWHRQKRPIRRNKAISLRSNSTTPDPYLPPAGLMMSEPLSQFRSGSRLEKGTGTMTTGEYYDQMESQARSQNSHHGYDPNARGGNANGAIPTHQAYNPQMVSRIASRDPTAPPAIHQYSRSDPSGSYMAQPYLQPAQNNLPASLQQPTHARTISSNSHLQNHQISMPIPPPPPPPQQRKHSKVPSLSLPSVPRVRVPKQYVPPQISDPSSRPSHDGQTQGLAVHISGPIMDSDVRFHDKLGGTGMSVPVSQQIPPSQLKVAKRETSTSPLRTGKSTLFGGY